MLGDHGAFSELAATAAGRMLAIARLMLRDTEAAEDAVQEALVTVWRDLPSLRDPERFDGWLYRILVRACYREGRRRGRLGRMELQIEPIGFSINDESGPIALRDQLEFGFRRLDPEQRAIVVLHFYAGLTLPEVADVLVIPLGTAKSRLHRALRDMRATLDAERRELALREGRA